MLMQPTIEKLHSMKLFGMAEAIRRQSEDPETSRLSFEERLACQGPPSSKVGAVCSK
jgi:hypothetical protein